MSSRRELDEYLGHLRDALERSAPRLSPEGIDLVIEIASRRPTRRRKQTMSDSPMNGLTDWTPGPWHVCEKSSATVRAGTRLVANTGGYTRPDDGEHHVENDANARLIALAPEMADMLRRLVEPGRVLHLIDARNLLAQLTGEQVVITPPPP